MAKIPIMATAIMGKLVWWWWGECKWEVKSVGVLVGG